MNRRGFLASSGVAITTLSAGCTDILSSDERDNYEFSIYNGSQETHSFRIRIGSGAARDWFYSETFELGGETAEEDVPIENVPSHMFLTIDSSDEFEFAWPASHSELGQATLRANIYYEPTQPQEILITAE